MIKSNLFDKFHYYILVAILFLLPLNKKIIPVLIFVLFLNWLIKLITLKYSRKLIEGDRLYVLLFISPFLFYLIGLIYSSNINYGLFDIQVKLSLLLFPFIFGFNDRFDQKKMLYLFFSFIAGCVLASSFCLFKAFYNYLETGSDGFFFYTAFSIFHHPSYFAMYLNFAIATLVYLIFSQTENFRKLNKILIVLLILFFISIIILLSSKMGIITSIVILGISIIYLACKKRKILLGVYLILVLSIFYVIFIKYFVSPDHIRKVDTEKIINPSSLKKNTEESSNVRILIWEASLSIIKNNLFFGVGTGDVKDQLLETYEKKKMTGAHKNNLNAHNQFFQTFISIGFLGFIFFLSSLVVPFLKNIQRKNYVYPIFVIIVSLNFITESMLEAQAGVVFYALFNSLLFFNTIE